VFNSEHRKVLKELFGITTTTAKLARALLIIASQEPPRRFIAGAGAIATAEQVVADLNSQIDANRNGSTSLAFDQEPVPRAMYG